MNRPTLAFRPVAATLLAALLLLPALQAGAQDFPRLGLYGSIQGNGYPYLDATGNLDPTVIAQVGRYHEVVLDASPISEYHPEILAALRTQRSDVKCLAYVLGHSIWDVNDADSLVHYPTRYNHLVRNLNGFLYNKAGGWYSVGNVNIAKVDAYGHYVVAESLAVLFRDAIWSRGIWDGFFLDVYCDYLGWSQTPAESIDVVRAGYPNTAAFDVGWKAGTDTLAARLRQFCGPTALLVGNCAAGSKYAWFNGWMRENFPFQDGGTWYENMFRTSGGYFVDDAMFRSPPQNYIFTMQAGTNPYDANNARKVRFGLGSAALGEGFGVFGPGNRSVATAPYHTWWYDEYAVDLVTGSSSGLVKDTGWLGSAKGPWYQMIWAGTSTDAVTNPDFETDVTTGWSWYTHPSVIATHSRDATTAAVGNASARIDVTTAGAVDWYVSYSSVGTISVYTGETISATFWAKASKSRQITVAASAGVALALRTLDLGTSWKQYQVVLQPNATGSVRLQLFLGLDTGSVWFDDVHLQAGATNLYRRDFTNGSVLVNPASAPLTVPVGTGFRKILGTVDPVTNNGATVSSVTIAASDAVFLIRSDTIPPAAVQDLRISH